MVKFLPLAAVALAASPDAIFVHGAKNAAEAGINRASTAACLSEGNAGCGEGK